MSGQIGLEPDEVLAIQDVEQSAWDQALGIREQGFGSFVACRASSALNVVVCMTSRRPRPEAFSQESLDFVRRLALRLDYEIRIAQKEDELSLSRALFETFMNHSPVAAFLKTQDGTHLYANRPKEEGLRAWAEGFLGRSDFDTLPREVAENIRIADRRVFEGRETVQLTERLTIPELGPRHLQLLKFPVDSPDGHTLIGSVAIDVTERVQAEDALRAQVQRLTALNQIDRTLVGSVNLGASLKQVLERTRAVVPCQGAAIYALSPSTYEFQCLSKIGVLRPDRRFGDRRLAATYVSEPCAAFRRENDSAALNSTTWIRLVARGQEVGLFRFEREAGNAATAADTEFLDAVASVVAMAIDSDRLRLKLEGANEELQVAYHATLEGWSRSLDARDRETEGHSRRVAEMALALAKRLGYPADGLLDFGRGALLHDIGKIGIPDYVLHKRGPLNDEEWAIMRSHPGIARDMLSEIGFLARALDIPYCHHEKWDGSGYPLGLSGRDIPWAARIFAVVDAFDALTSDRPYRTAWSRRDALDYIEQQSGRHFDPNVAAEFLRMMTQDFVADAAA
jgi:PAS domain S-box-containing protein